MRNVHSVNSPPVPRQELVDLLLEARTLVTQPDNSFLYSSWLDSGHAASEIDGILTELASDRELPERALASILLPTGPMQELAIESGWGDEFVDLATRIDAAVAGARVPS